MNSNKSHFSKQFSSVSLALVYLFVCLSVIFLLPKNALAHNVRVKVHAAVNCQLNNWQRRSFLKRTDKIHSSQRKIFFARVIGNPVGTPPVIFAVQNQLTYRCNDHDHLAAYPSQRTIYLLNRCRRI